MLVDVSMPTFKILFIRHSSYKSEVIQIRLKYLITVAKLVTQQPVINAP